LVIVNHVVIVEKEEIIYAAPMTLEQERRGRLLEFRMNLSLVRGISH